MSQEESGDTKETGPRDNPFAQLAAPSAAEIGDHDQILAYFQELTHLDDIEQCQAILESTDWDLDQAVQSFYNADVGAHATRDDLLNSHAHTEALNVVGSSAGITSLIGDAVNASSLSQNLFSRLRMPHQDLLDPFGAMNPLGNHAAIVDHMREEM